MNECMKQIQLTLLLLLLLFDFNVSVEESDIHVDHISSDTHGNTLPPVQTTVNFKSSFSILNTLEMTSQRASDGTAQSNQELHV